MTGVAIGPHALGWVREARRVESLAEFGVALILLFVGLEFPIRRLKALGRTSFVGGSLQMALTAAAGFALARLAGSDAERGGLPRPPRFRLLDGRRPADPQAARRARRALRAAFSRRRPLPGPRRDPDPPVPSRARLRKRAGGGGGSGKGRRRDRGRRAARRGRAAGRSAPPRRRRADGKPRDVHGRRRRPRPRDGRRGREGGRLGRDGRVRGGHRPRRERPRARGRGHARASPRPPVEPLLRLRRDAARAGVPRVAPGRGRRGRRRPRRPEGGGRVRGAPGRRHRPSHGRSRGSRPRERRRVLLRPRDDGRGARPPRGRRAPDRRRGDGRDARPRAVPRRGGPRARGPAARGRGGSG